MQEQGYLCVGGPLAGKRRTPIPGQPVYEFAVRVRKKWKKHRYFLMTVKFPSYEKRVYIYEKIAHHKRQEAAEEALMKVNAIRALQEMDRPKGRFVADPGQPYGAQTIFVCNNSGASLVPGKLVYWDTL